MERPALALALAAAVALALPAGAADFVGPESCKSCHPEAYAQWKASRHATAEEPLTPAQKKDARCAQCHAPNAAAGVSGVSCETCHGAGQYYVAPYVMRDRELARAVGLNDSAARTCRLCHDASAPSLRPADPAQLLERIKHWQDRTSRAPAFLGAALAAKRAPAASWHAAQRSLSSDVGAADHGVARTDWAPSARPSPGEAQPTGQAPSRPIRQAAVTETVP